MNTFRDNAIQIGHYWKLMPILGKSNPVISKKVLK